MAGKKYKLASSSLEAIQLFSFFLIFCSHHMKLKHYVELFYRSVIEHDSEEFSSISLLLTWHDFSFIIIGKFFLEYIYIYI